MDYILENIIEETLTNDSFIKKLCKRFKCKSSCCINSSCSIEPEVEIELNKQKDELLEFIKYYKEHKKNFILRSDV